MNGPPGRGTERSTEAPCYGLSRECPQGSCAEGKFIWWGWLDPENSDLFSWLISCSFHSGIDWSLNRCSHLEERSPEDTPLIHVSCLCSTVPFPTPSFLLFWAAPLCPPVPSLPWCSAYHTPTGNRAGWQWAETHKNTTTK